MTVGCCVQPNLLFLLLSLLLFVTVVTFIMLSLLTLSSVCSRLHCSSEARDLVI